jgi:hypothetical protein
MVDRHQVVNVDGAACYLAHPERLAMPILLVQGEHNDSFRPERTLRTLDELTAANGSTGEPRRKNALPTTVYRRPDHQRRPAKRRPQSQLTTVEYPASGPGRPSPPAHERDQQSPRGVGEGERRRPCSSPRVTP